MLRGLPVLSLLLATLAVASATRGSRYPQTSKYGRTNTRIVKRVKVRPQKLSSVTYYKPLILAKRGPQPLRKPTCSDGEVFDVATKQCVNVSTVCPEGTQLSLSAGGEQVCAPVCSGGTVPSVDPDGRIFCSPVCDEGTELSVDSSGELVCRGVPMPAPAPTPTPSPTPVPPPTPTPTPTSTPSPSPTPTPSPTPSPTPVPPPTPTPTPSPTPTPTPAPPPTPTPTPSPTPTPTPAPPPTPTPTPSPTPDPTPTPTPPVAPCPEGSELGVDGVCVPTCPEQTVLRINGDGEFICEQVQPPPTSKGQCLPGSFFMDKVESRGCTECDVHCKVGSCADLIGCSSCKPGFFTQREDPDWPYMCIECASVFPGCKKCSQNIDTLLGETVTCLAY